MTAPISSIETDKDLYEFLCDGILNEDVDQETAARLLSQAKNDLENQEKPEFLQDEDTSKTRASGDTYLSMKSLPDNFRLMLELFVGTNRPPLIQVPFKKRHTYQHASNRYYIDLKNSQFAICGNAGAGETIRQVYLIKTPDITAASIDAEDTTLVWPAEWRDIVAWHAAQLISSGTDVGADDLSFRMSAAQRNRYEERMRSFRSWNHDTILASMDHRAGFDDSEGAEDPDIESVLGVL